jgi:predicted AAA+ superfamily ATPase
MKRIIDYQLSKWKKSDTRKPLLIRGARQVGKTYSIRELGKTFGSFVEINFELMPKAAKIFDDDLQPTRIIRDLSILAEQPIEPGKTLLFFDEIQRVPQAINALRYFHELAPDLHVVSAGSLLEFALEKTGMPVGRISTLYLYPLCFVEFFAALGNKSLAEMLMESGPSKPLPVPAHQKFLKYLAEFLATGGMPAAVKAWITTQSMVKCADIHADLIESFRQDFLQYAKKHQQPYVEKLFNEIPGLAGRKFKTTAISGEHRKRELAPALDLLEKAGIIHKVFHSPGQGIPLGANADRETFKTIFLDCALAQALLGLKTGEWIISANDSFANRGEITESFIGQELLALMPPHNKYQLYYWLREARSSTAEVDYLLQIDKNVIPVEVKSGATGALRSIHLFLEEHAHTPFGIRFSSGNYSIYEKIRSYPLYAAVIAAESERSAMEYLFR